MDKRKTVLVLIAWVLTLLPGTSLAVLVEATDIKSEVIGGNFTTFDFTTSGGGALEMVVIPNELTVLDGASLHLELQLVQYGSGPIPTFGAEFTGTSGGGSDLLILCGAGNGTCAEGSTVLSATVNSVFVSNFGANAAQEIISITLGGLDDPSQSSFSVLDDPYSIFSGDGSFKLALNTLLDLAENPYRPSIFSQAFDTDFTASSNLQMIAPEPASGVLLGGALAALSAWRRREKSRA